MGEQVRNRGHSITRGKPTVEGYESQDLFPFWLLVLLRPATCNLRLAAKTRIMDYGLQWGWNAGSIRSKSRTQQGCDKGDPLEPENRRCHLRTVPLSNPLTG